MHERHYINENAREEAKVHLCYLKKAEREHAKTKHDNIATSIHG